MPAEQDVLDTQLFDICSMDNKAIDLAQLKEILDKGANPNSLHKWTIFASSYGNEGSSRYPLLQIIAAGANAIEAAKLLLSYGAQLTSTDTYTGNTVLHTAIAVKNEDYAIFIIEEIKKSVDSDTKQLLDQKDRKSDWLNSPLVLAFKKGLKNTISALLSAGADGTIADRIGTRPLHWAALLRYDAIIEQLLTLGVDITVPTEFNHTAFDLYQYELRPLDQEFKLLYNPDNHTAKVTLTTNLPEISELRFHGFHRDKQPATPRICELLRSKQSHDFVLEQEYLENFKTQDAIARSARVVVGREYCPYILPNLRSEGEHFYGFKPTLPDYAPETNQSLFSGAKRKDLPDFKKTREQITLAIKWEAVMKQSASRDAPKASEVLSEPKQKSRNDSNSPALTTDNPELARKSKLEAASADKPVRKLAERVTFFDKIVGQSIGIPDLPWAEVENTPACIDLMLDKLRIIYNKAEKHGRLKFIIGDKELGMRIETEDIKTITKLLTDKNIEQLMTILASWGETSSKMSALLRDGIQKYIANNQDAIEGTTGSRPIIDI